MAITVTVKWGKEIFKDVELDPTEPLETFQAQLFCLSGVPVDRQKILSKGKKIAVDADLLKVKAGQRVMLMGTASELPKAPEKATVFEEDLTDDQKVQFSGALGGGLNNLGNTCYMNSTLQCFRGVKELKEGLYKYANQPPSPNDMDHNLTSYMGRLFKNQETNASAVTPMMFVQTMRTLLPQFAETSAQGGFMQQDADECLGAFFTTMSKKLKSGSNGQSNLVDDLFGGTFTETTKCLEGGEDAPKVKQVPFRKLRCHIDSSTNHMAEGITKSLEEQIEFNSPSLGRNAMHSRQSKVSTLPRYAIVQFVRFFWRNDTQKKAKILRKVVYPLKFDIMSLCDDDLKKTLSKARRVMVADQDKELGLTPLGAKEVKKEEDKKDEDNDTAMADADVLGLDDVPETDTSGMYTLMGVVTHKGRSADSGHYVGWVKKEQSDESTDTKEEEAKVPQAKKPKPEDEEWIKYDDETVTVVKASDVQFLSGGGDWHMSYMLFYRRNDDMLRRRQKKAAESK